MRDTDQLHIGEHHARTLFTIVHQHFNTLGAQLGVQFLRQLLHTVRLVHVHRQDRHLERRNRIRPDDTAIVKVLLNRRRYHASHPDTIAAHGQDLVTAIFALDRGFHRLGVLRP